MLDDITDWESFLSASEVAGREIRKAVRTGRPLGSERFIDQLESLSGRSLRPKKRGPRPRS